jgi:hypothetical protein
MSLSLGRGKQKQLSLCERENRPSSSPVLPFEWGCGFSLGRGIWPLMLTLGCLLPPSPRATTSHKCFFQALESPVPNLRLKGPQVGHKLKEVGKEMTELGFEISFFLFFLFFVGGFLCSQFSPCFFFLPNCVLTKFPIMLPLCSSSSHKFYKLFPIAPNFIPYPFPNFF